MSDLSRDAAAVVAPQRVGECARCWSIGSCLEEVSDMARITGETVIERPVEVVFDYVADQRNEPTYNPRMVRSRKLTDGPIGVGTRFGATATSGRRRVDMLVEVTDYDRPRRFGSRVTMAFADIDGGLTFEPIGAGTRMGWSWDVRPKGFARLLPSLVIRTGRRQEERIWGSLKRHLESARTTRPQT